MCPPRRRTRNFPTSPQNMHTCCCRESMETSCTTETSRTWMGESQTTTFGSVVDATPSGAVGHRFTAILATEWQSVLNSSWKSERPLVFANVLLTKKLGIHRPMEIRTRITSRMDPGREVSTWAWWGLGGGGCCQGGQGLQRMRGRGLGIRIELPQYSDVS